MIISSLKLKKNAKHTITVVLYAVYALSCLLLFSEISYAQDVEAEALFKRGILQYGREMYVSARLDFTDIIELYPTSNRVTSAYMMLSKTLYCLEVFNVAETTALELQKKFPKSRYADWSNYMIAACKFKAGDIETATATLAKLAGSTKDISLKTRSLNVLQRIIQPISNQDTFLEVIEDNGLQQSDLNISSLPETGQTPMLVSEQSTPEKRTIFTSGNTIKIGLLTPLSGIYASQGNDLLKGVMAAYENYTSINGTPIEILYQDTASDMFQTVIMTRRLIESGVVAIIGPVYGESTGMAAMECQASGIPFIAPTSSDVGLPYIGNNIFQLNLTPATQALALADFAVNTLGYSNAAVIASKDQWGETVLDTFTREMKRLGADIIVAEYFDPGVSRYNYHDILTKIRANAPESTTTTNNMIIIDHGNAYPDTIFISLSDEGTQRLVEIDTIDCILISAVSEDAIRLSRQISEYNINTVLLGDTGWGMDINSSNGGQYIEGSYIVSTENSMAPNHGSTYFSDDFTSRNIELVSIFSKKGYDACAVLIHCIAQGARDSRSLVKSLESVEDFNGLSSRLTINPESHTNTAVDFFHYLKDDYTRVERIR